MSITLHFPNAKIMEEYLCNHSLLKSDYNVEKGINKAVAKLAAERFADSERYEMGVKLGSMLIMEDLKSGKDGFTGKKIFKLGLPDMCVTMLSMSLESALIDCAKEYSTGCKL